MKSVWRERRKGSAGCEIYADVFETVPFSFFLTVGAVCGWRGVGWISRKGGWDAQTKGEKGEVQRIQSHIVEDGHGRQ